MRVFFTVARLEYVQRYQACLDAVGMKTAMVDIDVFALLRAARHALRDIWMDQEKICVLYVGNNYAVIVAQHSGHMLFHQQWDGGSNGTHTMTCWQWLEWCCHTWRHLEIASVAVGGSSEHIYHAAAVIAEKWPCKIYEPDPFQSMLGASMVDKVLMSSCPSAFLLACGLAMRKVLPWWK